MIEDLSVKNKMNSIISLYYCQRIVLVLTILRERKSHRSISRLDYEINRWELSFKTNPQKRTHMSLN